MLRVLCLCNGGNVRSTTLARMLRKRKHEVLSAGVDERFSDATLIMLLDWCQVVFAQRDAAERLGGRPNWGVSPGGNNGAYFSYVNQEHVSGKPFSRTGFLDFRFDVGPDDWKIPDHPDLIRRYRALFVEGAMTGL